MARQYMIILCLAAAFLPLIATDMDNGIVGTPDVTCLAHEMGVQFQTKKPFQGHVYIRGHYDEPDCHKDYVLNRHNSGVIDVKFDKCGMRRKRELNPRGMSMTAVLIVSFHRKFVTAIDKAFSVECFYMEAEKVVTQQIQVSALPTVEMPLANPAMPECKYEVLPSSQGGEHLQFATVGQSVYHKWSCDYPMDDMYCMVVHSCTVDDGETELHQIVDENGCSKDRLILSELNYLDDLVAGTPTNVFKFADKTFVYFSCQIRLSLKHEHGNICPRPACDNMASLQNMRARRSLHRRLLLTQNNTHEEDVDVMAAPVLVLDLDESTDVHEGLDRLIHRKPSPLSYSDVDWPSNRRHFGNIPPRASPSICLSSLSFGILIAASLLCCLTAVVFTALYFVRASVFK